MIRRYRRPRSTVPRIPIARIALEFPERSWPLLGGLRVLVLDALRPKPHAAHFSLGEALEVIARVKPEQAYLTHMGHEMEYDALMARLPAGVEPAYDGLRFEF